MTIPIFIEMVENPPWDGTKREHDRIMRNAYANVGRLWASEMLPRHFKPEAHGIYHYQPRTPGTIKRKARDAVRGKAIEGGTVDLVWTGLMRTAVTGHQSIRAKPDGVQIKMFGPRYLWAFRKGSAPDKAQEITTVIPAEAEVVADHLGKDYAAGVNTIHDTKTTRMGG